MSKHEKTTVKLDKNRTADADVLIRALEAQCATGVDAISILLMAAVVILANEGMSKIGTDLPTRIGTFACSIKQKGNPHGN